jgi:hypothetical protein
MQLLFLFYYELDHGQWRLCEEMLLKHPGICHGSMAAPAEEGYVSPESNVSCPVLCWIRLYCMAEETNRLAVYHQVLSPFIEHDVRIDLSILFRRMTGKADSSPISIGTSPQEVCTPSCMVFMMTGQTLDLSVIEREREFGRIGGCDVDRVVVFPVFMAFQAFRRWINSLLRERNRHLNYFVLLMFFHHSGGGTGYDDHCYEY